MLQSRRLPHREVARRPGLADLLLCRCRCFRRFYTPVWVVWKLICSLHVPLTNQRRVGRHVGWNDHGTLEADRPSTVDGSTSSCSALNYGDRIESRQQEDFVPTSPCFDQLGDEMRLAWHGRDAPSLEWLNNWTADRSLLAGWTVMSIVQYGTRKIHMIPWCLFYFKYFISIQWW
jgi:hypothetical protein